jgi:hypothetical protein
LRSRIASTRVEPSPGRENTFSMMIAPDSSEPNCRPAIVITGSSALRSACSTRTRRSGSPLARAVRT